MSRQAMEIRDGAGTCISQSTHGPGRSRLSFGEVVASMYPPVNTASTDGSPLRMRTLATTVALGDSRSTADVCRRGKNLQISAL